MSRDEFERRYEAMPGVKKAELIEGVVHMASPVRLECHGEQHVALAHWLATYWVATPGLRTGDNSTARLDLDNEPQPDLLLMIPRSIGGQAQLVDGYVEGSPELVLELASSTVSIDMHDKLRVYRRTGVGEYIVWRVFDRAIDWFERRGSEFVLKQPDADGLLKSSVFPGLWLDAPSLLAGELPKVIAALSAGLATPEHAAFVADLAGRAKTA